MNHYDEAKWVPVIALAIIALFWTIPQTPVSKKRKLIGLTVIVTIYAVSIGVYLFSIPGT